MEEPESREHPGVHHGVRWGTSSFDFEILSSDTRVARRARTVFRPWRTRASSAPVQCWQVEPTKTEAGERWEIRPRSGGEVAVSETLEKAVTLVEYLAVQALHAHPQGPITLHGALVAKEGNGVVLLGHGEAGKSTLATALWLWGWSLLCDDTTQIDLSHPPRDRATPPRARATPRRVSLRNPSQKLLGAELWERVDGTVACDHTSEGILFHPDEVDGRRRPESVRIEALIFLERRESSAHPGALKRLDPAHALLAVLPYSNLARRCETGEVIARMAPLADAVAAYDLGRDELSTMVRSVNRLLEGAG